MRSGSDTESSLNRELRNKGSVEWRKLIGREKDKKEWGERTAVVERGKNGNKKRRNCMKKKKKNYSEWGLKMRVKKRTKKNVNEKGRRVKWAKE